MRKQTKLVAVLSAAALLAMGASMTSFAAGWEKDDAGIYHYYDADGEMVTGEWKKDEGKWFYLDDEGDMLTDAWVDDDYYVGDNGAMLVNAWKKTLADEDMDSPDDEGEHWYYFGSKGKKVTGDTKKINGRTYLFNEDGEMQYGWQVDSNGNGYYYGGEDEGWRAESQWMWLEKSGLVDTDEDEQDQFNGCSDANGEMCDDEGWYWFQSSGKVYNGTDKKKINGRYYMFNEHGQMLYEWINNNTVNRPGSNAQLDGKLPSGAAAATAGEMFYYNVVEEGWRGDGWYEIDGSEDMGTDSDTDWYYIDDGKITHAAQGAPDAAGTTDDGDQVYVMRKKIKESGNKYFAFNEKGQMQTGLQYVADDGGFYYFDENGYQKTGRVSSVECEDDDYTFYFTAKNGKNGLGVTGEKDGYLYFNGKRLEADDDYRFYLVDKKIYLVNTKGKIQKATGNGKKYDNIENAAFEGKEVTVKTKKSGVVETASYTSGSTTTTVNLETDWSTYVPTTIDATNRKKILEGEYSTYVNIPFVALYDGVRSYVDLGTGVNETWY